MRTIGSAPGAEGDMDPISPTSAWSCGSLETGAESGLHPTCQCESPCSCNISELEQSKDLTFEDLQRQLSVLAYGEQTGAETGVSGISPRSLRTSTRLDSTGSDARENGSVRTSSGYSGERDCSPGMSPVLSDSLFGRSPPQLPAHLQSEELYEGEGEEQEIEFPETDTRHLSLCAQRSLPVAVQFSRRLSLPCQLMCSRCHSDHSNSDDDLDDRIERLHEKEEMLSSKIEIVEQEKASSIDRVIRLQAELTEKSKIIHELEDRLKEAENKSQDERKAEKRISKVKLSQVERNFAQQIDTMRLLLAQSEDAQASLRDSEDRMRRQLAECKEEKEALGEGMQQLQQKHSTLTTELTACQEQLRRDSISTKAVILAMEEQLGSATRQAESMEQRCRQLESKGKGGQKAAAGGADVDDRLQAKICQLTTDLVEEKRKNDELCSLLVLQSNALMMEGENLASEIEAQSKDELLQTLRDEQLHSQQLKHYIGSLLAVVMDKNPELLEVKARSR